MTTRSMILSEAERWLFRLLMLVSVFVALRGHNLPGGGFAGGLIAGCAFVLRFLASGRVGVRGPAGSGALGIAGIGLALAAITALSPLLFGDPALSSSITELELWVFGSVKLVSSTVFDVGVYLLVLGSVLTILESLGAEVTEVERP